MGTFIAPPQNPSVASIPQAPHLDAPQGTSPYPQNGVGQVMQATTQFVQSFLANKKAAEENSKQKFFESVQLAALGLPVDSAQVMKYAQKAKIPLRNEPYTPEEQAAQKEMQAYQGIQANGGGGGQTPPMDPMLAMVPGAAAANAQGAQQFATPPPQVAPPAPPGMWQKMQNVMHGNPATGAPNPQGPGMQSIEALSQAGQTQGGMAGDVAGQRQVSAYTRKFQNLDMNQKTQMLQLQGQAVSGDVHARDILARAGVWKEMPGDEIAKDMRLAFPNAPEDQVQQKVGETLLWMNTGGPQMLGYRQAMIKDMLPHFGFDLSKTANYVMDPQGSGVQPQLTPEELEKSITASSKIHDMNPTAPSNLATIAGMAMLTGQKGLFDSVMNTINQNYPTEGAQKKSEFDKELNVKTYNAQSDRLRANVDLGGLQQRISNENSMLDLSKLHAIAEAAGDQGKIAMEMLNRKDATQEDQKNALDMLASAVSKKSNLKVNYRGQDFTIADPVKAVQDLPWYSQQRIDAQQGLQLMKPNDSFWGGQAPPQTYGTHPQTTEYLDKVKAMLANKSAAERKAIIHNSLAPSDPTGTLLEWFKKQDQSQEPTQ